MNVLHQVNVGARCAAVARAAGMAVLLVLETCRCRRLRNVMHKPTYPPVSFRKRAAPAGLWPRLRALGPRSVCRRSPSARGRSQRR